ncbi:MAG: type IV toxin-antitoxin system AbiEi family antitoxin domain-containing protein [Candidatus Margulisbacteria bacterium]|nr:type IV toxin-antitoxin system AbiEi family antitoxin domain-containing protein [Candidatus Margulisiibacteriota bacterium]
MRNKPKSKINKIMALAKQLPCFSLADLASVEPDHNYLKITLSRYKKSGKLLKIRRGLYVSSEYINALQKKGRFSIYPEFIASILYQPSYLSLDYVLYQHNLLTEIARNFTAITRNKTAHFTNAFGNYFYHKIKAEFFCGFKIIKINNFVIYKATKAKSLFDYLYLRRNLLVNKKAVRELRLNMGNFNQADVREFKQYLKLAGTQKVAEIFAVLME